MKSRGQFLCGVGSLALVVLLHVTTLLAPAGHAQEPEGPYIEGVRPAEGHCGSEMTLTVFGANFEPESRLSIPDGVETSYTEFISPEELTAEIVIADDAPPGPRPVEVFGPELGAATLEEAFVIICGEPVPEGRPDLVLLGLDWEIVEEGYLLVIIAHIENAGDAPASEAVVYAESQLADWWAAEAVVPGLDSGDGVEAAIELEIPEELRERSHTFRVVVEAREEIAEWDVDNNWQEIEIWVPEVGEPPQPPPGPLREAEPEFDLIPLVLTVVVVVSVTVVGVTLTVRRMIKIRRRKKWQEQAKEGEPPETCQPCTRHCRKIEVELEPARRKVVHLALIAQDPVSGERSQTGRVEGGVVGALNKAVRARRRRQKPDNLERLVAPVAGMLLQQIGEWLRREPAPRDVFIVGHLAGGEVTFQFILYHCRRRGKVNVWEEEDKWKATVADEHDEPVIALRGLDTADRGMLERLVPELTQWLVRFIEKV